MREQQRHLQPFGRFERARLDAIAVTVDVAVSGGETFEGPVLRERLQLKGLVALVHWLFLYLGLHWPAGSVLPCRG